jgi:tetratricopeptide (TPR) repeat protein
MPAILILAAAMAAAPVPSSAAADVQSQPVTLSGAALGNESTEATISRILASGKVEERDPAALINLGAAYARLGQKDRALAMFRAAIASPERYDLQLADGRWMDSRAAARLAAGALERGDRLVMR